MPGLGDLRGLTRAIVFVDTRLCVRDAPRAGGELRAMIACEHGGRRGTPGELLGVDVAAARDAVDVLVLACLARLGTTGTLAKLCFTFAFGQALLFLGHERRAVWQKGGTLRTANAKSRD